MLKAPTLFDAYLELAGVSGESMAVIPGGTGGARPGGAAGGAGGTRPIQVISFKFGADLVLQAPRQKYPHDLREHTERDVNWAVRELAGPPLPYVRRGGKYMDRFSMSITKYVDKSSPALLQNYAANQVAVQTAIVTAVMAAAMAAATAAAAGSSSGSSGGASGGSSGGSSSSTAAAAVPPPMPLVSAMFPTGRLVFLKQSGLIPMLQLQLTLQRVFVLHYQLLHDNPVNSRPIEVVDLGFGACSMMYFPAISATQRQPPPPPMGWNFQANAPMA
jgi:hypothetical protein